MELLRDQFDQAFTNVDLGIRVQVAKAVHEEVRTYLEGRPELKLFGFRTTLIGSYPRRTAIWPGKDVDIFVGMTTRSGPTVMISSGPTTRGHDQLVWAPPLADVVTRSR